LRSRKADVTFIGDNCFYGASLPGRQRYYRVSRTDRAAGHAAGKTAKGCVRTNHALNWKSKLTGTMRLRDFDSFKMLHQCWACVPRHVFAALDDVVSFKRAHGNGLHERNAEGTGKFLKIAFQFKENILTIIN